MSGDLFAAPSRERIKLSLPWPPSVNDYWGTRVPKGGSFAMKYLTERARTYREHVVKLVLERFEGRVVPYEGEVLLDIVLYPPDARRRDLDNFNKGLWDALTAAGIFLDDSQVQSYRVTRGSVVRGGAVVVEIWERGSC